MTTLQIADSPRICPSAQPLGNEYEFTPRSDDDRSGRRKKRAKRRGYRLQAKVKQLMPESRVAQCYSASGDGSLNYSPTIGHAWVEGVYVCGDVWACPVCSQRISMKRTDELRQALAAVAERGWSAVLMTPTVQHERGDDLADLLGAFLKAFSRLKRVRRFRGLMTRLGYKGDINGLEVTYGVNGWHPHKHDILLFDHPLTAGEVDELRDVVAREWQRRLNAVGLDASLDHGVDVRAADRDIAEYVAKFGKQPEAQEAWGIAEEVGAAPLKRGRRGSLSPFQLLEVYGMEIGSKEFRQFGNIVNSPLHAGRLFVEYAQAFRGKHQLNWSAGLRDLLGLSEVESDEQLAEPDKVDDRVQLVTFSSETNAYLNKHVLWADFLWSGRNGDRQEVIDWMRSHGIAVIDLADFNMPSRSGPSSPSPLADFRNAVRSWTQTELIE